MLLKHFITKVLEYKAGLNGRIKFVCIATVHSNYDFTLTHVITCVHAWLHGKSCHAPRYMAACATTTVLSHVSMSGNYSYMAINAVVAACPNQLDAEGIRKIIYTVPVNTIFMVP